MEYESPVREGAANTYIVPIRTTNYLDIQYSSTVSGSHTTPPADSFTFTAYISDMAMLYEQYSPKWFDRNVLSIFFVKNVAHQWNHMSHLPYTSPPRYENLPIQVHQVWCPVKISVQMNKYTIHWKLLNSKYAEQALTNTTSGELPKSEEVPYGKNQIQMILKKTPRSEYHRKIRKARILLADSKVRLRALILRYTEKYGELDAMSDSESVLSFNSADN